MHPLDGQAGGGPASLSRDALRLEVLELEPGGPWVYAPRPLDHALAEVRNVRVRAYETGKGLLEAEDRRQDFTGVDVDVWLRRALEWVDALLSPRFRAPLRLLARRDGERYRGNLRELRRALADRLEELLIPVFADRPVLADHPEEHPVSDDRAARAVFREQLRASLANAYRVSAVVQFPMAVSAPVPEAGRGAPRLVGVASPRQPAPAVPAATAGAAWLPLRPSSAGDPSHLTFAVCGPGGADGAESGTGRLALSLEFRATHLAAPLPAGTAIRAAHLVEDPGGEGDSPAPARPLDESISSLPSVDLGSFEVPLVMRAAPVPPALAYQEGTASRPHVDDDPAAVTSWDYSFGYRVDHHPPQDRTHLQVDFSTVAGGAGPDERPGSPDVFAPLAEFAAVGPRVVADLERHLAPIDASTTGRAAYRKATAALTAFLTLTRGLIEGPGWTPPLSALPGRRSEVSKGVEYAVEETFREVEEAGGRERALMVVVRADPSPDPAPEVHVPGWTAKRVDAGGDALAFVYLDPATGAHLGEEEGRRIPDRVFVLRGLDVRRRQRASSSAWIVRNQDLVPGRETADAFVYTTARARFADALSPLLDHAERIDLAAFGGGVPRRRPLERHLEALLAALLVRAEPSQVIVRVECRYESEPGPAATVLPVLLLGPTTITAGPPARDGTPAPDGSGDVEALRSILVDAIEGWLERNRPRSGAGTLVFDLAMASPGSGPRSLLRLRALTLALEDVAMDGPPAPRIAAW